jgi:hypothetical protein
MQNLLHDLTLSDRVAKDRDVVGQTYDTHREVIHGLTFLEADFIKLLSKMLTIHLLHPLHTDAVRFDHLPCRLGGALGCEGREHLWRHGSKNGGEH